MHVLAPDETIDDVEVPDDGKEVCAVARSATQDPVEPGFRALLRRYWRIVRGRVTFRALTISAPGGADVPAPTDGNLDVGNDVNVTRDVNVFRDVACSRDVLAGRQIWAGTEHYTETAHSHSHLEAHRLRFTNLDGDVASANPPKNLALRNELRAVNTPKAWGLFHTTEVPIYRDGAGILDAALNGIHQLDITFAQAFDTTDYGVVPFCLLIGGGQILPTGINRTTTVLSLMFGGLDLSATNVEIVIHVQGRQTT